MSLLFLNEVPKVFVIELEIFCKKSNPFALLNARLLVNAHAIAITVVAIPPPRLLLKRAPEIATITKRILDKVPAAVLATVPTINMMTSKTKDTAR